jgi:hypothetical protein
MPMSAENAQFFLHRREAAHSFSPELVYGRRRLRRGLESVTAKMISASAAARGFLCFMPVPATAVV